jgi:hypothetical protein
LGNSDGFSGQKETSTPAVRVLGVRAHGPAAWAGPEVGFSPNEVTMPENSAGDSIAVSMKTKGERMPRILLIDEPGEDQAAPGGARSDFSNRLIREHADPSKTTKQKSSGKGNLSNA